MENNSPSCLDEIARRSKRNTRRKNGVKSESDDDYVPSTGARVDVPSADNAKTESSPGRPMANARKRRNCRQSADAKKTRKRMVHTITPPSDCSDSDEAVEDVSVSTTHDSTQQARIDACLSVVATMADDEPTHSGALKFLVKHRLPAAIFAPLQEYRDTRSWVVEFPWMRERDASTVNRVVQALEIEEGDRIANALLDIFKSPDIIESVCRKLGAHCKGSSPISSNAAVPQQDLELDEPQMGNPRQASLPLLPASEIYAETSSSAAEVALPAGCSDLRMLDHPVGLAKSAIVKSPPHRPDISAPELALKSMMMPTLVEFVRLTKDDKLWYALIPVDTPDLPTEDITLHHIRQGCSAAFSWPIRIAKAGQLGDNVWYAAFTQRAFISKHHKVDLVEKALWIRGRKCYTHYLPFEPPMLFAADVAMSNISTEEVINHLTPILEARGLARPTLFETKSEKEKSRRLVAHFHVNPNLLYFCVPVLTHGLAAPTVICFWPVDPSSATPNSTPF